jgi:hypothetical protein
VKKKLPAPAGTGTPDYPARSPAPYRLNYHLLVVKVKFSMCRKFRAMKSYGAELHTFLSLAMGTGEWSRGSKTGFRFLHLFIASSPSFLCRPTYGKITRIKPQIMMIGGDKFVHIEASR